MNSVLNTIGNISHSIQDTWNGMTHTSSPHDLTKAEAVFLEEQERARRVTSSSASRDDQLNAKKVSDLFSNLSFPYFKGNTSQGFKHVTRALEETERKRRMTTKPEAALRRMNANKAAGFIRSLGWPFINHSTFEGPEYVMADATYFLIEEERAYRMSNPSWGLAAKNNAALISNLLRWEWDNARNYSLGMKRWTRGVEEKERSARLADKIGMERSLVNAYNTSTFIRNLGWPFFVQEQQKVDTRELEEEERSWRLTHPAEQQLAREIAGKLFDDILETDKREERERSRRMANVDEQYAAIAHAKTVSDIIFNDMAKLMVEEERQFRIGAADVERVNARRIAHLIDGLEVTTDGVIYLEEKERKRRVADTQWQLLAREHAQNVSDLLGSSFGNKGIESLEEEERNRRMWNKNDQIIAMKNARAVSRLVMGAGDTSALEESERSRRLSDRNGELIAMRNAKGVSELVEGTTPASTPMLEEQERARRLANQGLESVARENAAKVSSLLPHPVDTPMLEEQERTRRLANQGLESVARENAAKVSSLLLPHSVDTPMLEEQERTRRLANQGLESVARENAAKVSSLLHPHAVDTPMLEEQERTRRLANQDSEFVAKENAAKVSSLLSRPANTPLLEEQERARRLEEQGLESIAKANAAKLSSMVPHKAKKNLPVDTSALEESERSERLSHPEHESMAKQNASKISSLVPTAHTEKPLPMIPKEVSLPRAVPTDFVPALSAPTVVIPIAPSPLVEHIALPVPVEALPPTPVFRAPLAPYTPVQQAPAPTYQTLSAPIYPQGTPTPFVSTRTYTYSSPVANLQSVPATATLPATGLQLHALNDSDKKRLEKQAIKHNKKAAKESKRASHNLAKAVKLHNKGKESRALKQESRAEQHSVAAKHHQLWANDLTKDMQQQVQQPFYSAIGSPSM